MIYEVITTCQADNDLKGIYEYIAFELLSPDNEVRQLERLEEHMIRLEEFPEKFKAYEKEPWHSRGMRVMPVDSYLVFYILDKDAGIVTIIRVMYAGRNIDNQLNNHTIMQKTK